MLKYIFSQKPKHWTVERFGSVYACLLLQYMTAKWEFWGPFLALSLQLPAVIFWGF